MPTSPSVIETADASASTSTTYSIVVGQSAHGTLTSGDSDWYAVHLVAGHTYTFAEIGINATTLRCQDTYLNLRNSSGTIVASNDDFDYSNGFINSQFTFTATTTGTYYVDAGSYNGSDPGEYGISVTAGTHANYDDYMGAGALLMGDAAWNSAAGTAATITYGFRQSLTGSAYDESTFSQCTPEEMAVIRSLLSLWSEVCNINFVEVNPGGYTNTATVLIGNYNNPNDGAGAYAYYPGSTSSASPSGDIWLNLGGGINPSSIPVGSYSYFAIMHEMGHMLGLAHPGPYNAGPGVQITYANDAMFVEDSGQRTIMSYFGEGNTGANFGPQGWADSDTPMLYDILAAQQLYGANMSTRTGDTTYGFNANTDHNDIYDANQNARLAFCVWDAGGNDTFDFSGYSQAQHINLGEATFSDVGGLVGNVSIAYGATIENAIGGSGSDTITGNNAANELSGNNGADRLYGRWGADTISGGAGNDTMVGGGGNDDLSGGIGNDRYTVENSGDRVHEVAGEGMDTVFCRVDFALGAGEAVEVMRVVNGTGGHALTGNEIANRLYGASDGDTLSGGGGSDRLYGGAGNDELSGGAGRDSFYFNTALDGASNVDTIRGFSSIAGASDYIYLDDAIFSGVVNAGGSLDASQFVANAGGVATATSLIIYDTATGALYYDADGSGSASARVQFATIANHATLEASDFVVF